jgi:hypothetical protein
MANVFPVFMDSNTIFSFTESNPATQFTIPEFVVKSSTNNYIMLKANDANVTINATSNISISSNTTFLSNVSLNANASFAANVSITGNNLVLGTSNNSANGYTWLPNGLIMQWGTVASNTTTGDVTFSVPFNTMLSFTSMATTVNSALNYTYATVLIASNTTTANIRTANTTSRSVRWLAIGT